MDKNLLFKDKNITSIHPSLPVSMEIDSNEIGIFPFKKNFITTPNSS